MDTLLRPCSEAAFTALDGGQKVRRKGGALLTGDAATASVMMLAVLRRRHQSQGCYCRCCPRLLAAIAWLAVPFSGRPAGCWRLFAWVTSLRRCRDWGLRCVQLARCACASDVL